MIMCARVYIFIYVVVVVVVVVVLIDIFWLLSYEENGEGEAGEAKA